MRTTTTNYFKLVRNFTDDSASVTGNAIGPPYVDYLDVFAGPVGADFFSRFEWSYRQRGAYDDFLGCNLSWIIISAKACEVLLAIEATGFELINLGLDKIDQGLAGYCLLKPLEALDVLDYDQSGVTWVEYDGRKTMGRPQRLIIRNYPLLPDVFAIEHLPYFLIISSKIVQAWKAAGVTCWTCNPIGQQV